MFSNRALFYKHRIPRLFFYLGILTIGQTVFRPILDFTISDWFFLFSLFSTISECLMRKNFPIRFPPYLMAGLFIFMLGGILSSTFAEAPFSSFLSLIKYLYLVAVWFWLCSSLLQSVEHVKISIFLWTFSAALSGFGSSMQLIWSDIIPGTSPVWNRMTGFTEHVNDLGGLTSISLIPAIIMLNRMKGKAISTILSWIIIIFTIAGLILSVSISSIFALLISVLTLLCIGNFSSRNIFIIAISSCLFFSIIFIHNRFENVSVLSRLSDMSIDGLSSITLQTRYETYISAWDSICEHPFLGIGLGPDIGITNTGYVVHNVFLSNWFESGFFGLLGIVIIFFSILRYAYIGIKDPTQENKKNIGVSLFSSFIAFLVLGMAQPIYFKRFGWISAALLIALYSQNRAKKSFLTKIKPKSFFYPAIDTQ